MGCYWAIKRKEILTQATTGMDLADMLSDTSQSHRDTLCDSTHMMSPEESDVWRQNVECWGWRRGDGEPLFNG